MKNIIGFGLVVVSALFANAAFGQSMEYTDLSKDQVAKLCKRAVSRQGSDADPDAHKECAGLDAATKKTIEDNAKELVKLRKESAEALTTANTAHAEAVSAKKTAVEAKKLAETANGTADEAKADAAKANVTADGAKVLVGWVGERTTEVEREQRRQSDKVEGIHRSQVALVGEVGDNTSRIEELEAWKREHDDMRLKLEMKVSGMQLASLKGGFGFRGSVASIGISHGVVTPKLRLYGLVGLTFAGTAERAFGGQVKLGGTYDLGKNWFADVGWASYGLGFGGTDRDPLVVVSGIEPGITKRFGVFSVGANVMPIGIASSYRAKSGGATGGIVGGALFIGLSL